MMGHYEFNEDNDSFKVRWLRPEDYRKLNGEVGYNVPNQLSDLEATLLENDFRMTLSGKMGNDSIKVELSKVK
jgi:hypothetical protein